MIRSGCSSAGRARPCQGRGHEFESRYPLQILKPSFILGFLVSEIWHIVSIIFFLILYSNFWLAGKMHRAEATEATFEAAIDVVKDELDRELNKEHDKHQTLVRKGGREIKEAIRFGGEE